MAVARTFSALTNRLVSASASVVAVAALGTSLYEARLNREQQRAAVWPYVAQGNTGTGSAHYARVVRNVGVGPALVRSFRVSVDGRPRRTWGDVLDALGVHVPRGGGSYSSVGRGEVLIAGQALEIFTISDSAAAVAFARAAFGGRASRLDTRICYCSLYGECWSGSSEADEPRPVDACPPAADSAKEFMR